MLSNNRDSETSFQKPEFSSVTFEPLKTSKAFFISNKILSLLLIFT